jgi:tRNA(His) 5'-end guanylyltransferase
MAAQSMFSHKELQGKSSSALQEMMFTIKGVNWNDYPVSCKNGTMVTKKQVKMKNIEPKKGQPEIYVRSAWYPEGAQNFRKMLPKFLPSIKTELEVDEILPLSITIVHIFLGDKPIFNIRSTVNANPSIFI